MNTSYVHNAYMTTGINNLSPLDLIIKLYDGAINFLTKAANAINNNDSATKLNYINKTRAIIEELLSSLRIEEGGEVAQNLQDLYTYMLIELAKTNSSNDSDKLYHIQDLLKTLKSAWQEVRLTVPQSELTRERVYKTN
ncbi:Flagellar protein FliS [Candidatus Magnetoovum chiemensis]|nr:Flagellar protein FliS [Candidatus Magnetoovum chiemensis]